MYLLQGQGSHSNEGPAASSGKSRHMGRVWTGGVIVVQLLHSLEEHMCMVQHPEAT